MGQGTRANVFCLQPETLKCCEIFCEYVSTHKTDDLLLTHSQYSIWTLYSLGTEELSKVVVIDA